MPTDKSRINRTHPVLVSAVRGFPLRMMDSVVQIPAVAGVICLIHEITAHAGVVPPCISAEDKFARIFG